MPESDVLDVTIPVSESNTVTNTPADNPPDNTQGSITNEGNDPAEKLVPDPTVVSTTPAPQFSRPAEPGEFPKPVNENPGDGNLTQEQRVGALKEFREGQTAEEGPSTDGSR